MPRHTEKGGWVRRAGSKKGLRWTGTRSGTSRAGADGRLDFWRSGGISRVSQALVLPMYVTWGSSQGGFTLVKRHASGLLKICQAGKWYAKINPTYLVQYVKCPHTKLHERVAQVHSSHMSTMVIAP